MKDQLTESLRNRISMIRDKIYHNNKYIYVNFISPAKSRSMTASRICRKEIKYTIIL